jgi:uncharacterized alkaline shock family protein YloU
MLMETEFGTIDVKSEVIKELVYEAVIESYGAVEITGKQGFFDRISSLWSKSEDRGINILEDEESVTVELYLVLEYGLPIKKVAQNIQENVHHRVKSMLNFDNIKVNVSISGLKY